MRWVYIYEEAGALWFPHHFKHRFCAPIRPDDAYIDGVSWCLKQWPRDRGTTWSTLGREREVAFCDDDMAFHFRMRWC